MVKNVLKTAALSLGIAMLFAGVALAHGSGSGTKSVKVTLKGTGGGSAGGGNTGTDGQCINTGDSWLDDYTCSGPGNCTCGVLASPTVSGGNGLKGATVTNFFVTGDQGINPATAPTVPPGPDPQCNPFLGFFTITDSSANSTTINFLGVSCNHVTKVSSKNPSGSNDKDLMSGGWGISDTPVPTNPTSGWGTFTGTVNHATNAVSLTLSGWLTQ